jgi:hypothetical protein
MKLNGPVPVNSMIISAELPSQMVRLLDVILAVAGQLQLGEGPLTVISAQDPPSEIVRL